MSEIFGITLVTVAVATVVFLGSYLFIQYRRLRKLKRWLRLEDNHRFEQIAE